jgi:hypothetical protein
VATDDTAKDSCNFCYRLWLLHAADGGDGTKAVIKQNALDRVARGPNEKQNLLTFPVRPHGWVSRRERGANMREKKSRVR